MSRDWQGPNAVSWRDSFQVFATKASSLVGSKWAFIAAIFLILAWVVVGPYFHFSDSWQLVVNTATTIITFLMVFLIQNTQNRDARAIHLKLDEIIRSLAHAHNDMIDIENLADEQLELLAHRFERIRAEYEARRHRKQTEGNQVAARRRGGS